MSQNALDYERLVDGALKGVVRDALAVTARRGLPGAHHFYLTFKTSHPGVELSEALRSRYPDDMTIVLQHQFWGLEVHDDWFEVTLSFSGVSERIKVPFAALTSFVDPSVKFGLQFRIGSVPTPAAAVAGTSAKSPEEKPAEALPPLASDAAAGPAEKIVSLDAFRKK
ncbi:MAG TPA: ClpXP protease specificity-enhancing factor SspB [Alphaproteobacteria bacterium]|nr:ClpXP protease specificity-enhancing factor SspB [Alphaproteobacteria bacterium]